MAPAIPIIMGAAAIGGTVLSVVGKIKEGEAAAQAAEYNAQGAEENARLTRLAAAADEEKERFGNKLTMGSIRAQYGASGVKFDGSAKDYAEMNEAIGERNALDIRYKGELQAMAYKKQAQVYRAGGTAAQAAGVIGAGAAGLSGIANFAKRYA